MMKEESKEIREQEETESIPSEVSYDLSFGKRLIGLMKKEYPLDLGSNVDQLMSSSIQLIQFVTKHVIW